MSVCRCARVVYAWGETHARYTYTRTITTPPYPPPYHTHGVASFASIFIASVLICLCLYLCKMSVLLKCLQRCSAKMHLVIGGDLLFHFLEDRKCVLVFALLVQLHTLLTLCQHRCIHFALFLRPSQRKHSQQEQKTPERDAENMTTGTPSIDY